MNVTAKDDVLKKESLENCYHCGDTCRVTNIIQDDKSFCCEGCKLVYSLLQENNLGSYYDLNEQAGKSQRNYKATDYSFLENEETVAKLIDFEDDQIVKVNFYLPQIHCSSCLWLLENLCHLNEGVADSRVDFLKRTVSITYLKKQLKLVELVWLLEKIGYPPLIQLNDLEEDSKKAVDKTIYYKLGLAGFVFGNIMLFSFPEYLGLEDADNSNFAQYFGYLNILLILPVIVYSGGAYFKSAWIGIKQRYLNIDVPISLGIASLFLRSIYEILFQSGAGYLDSLAGLIFFLLIGKWFQKRTYDNISFDRDYTSYFPIATRRIIDQEEQSITLDKVNIGDRLVVRHGELIPTDGILMDGEGKIDYSFVTGESALIKRRNGEKVYAGGRQMGSNLELVTTSKVSNSYLTRLWNDHNFDKLSHKDSVSKIADRVGSFFTWAILLVAFATLFYWLQSDVGIAVNAFTAVLIIACPCAVALSIPFTFGNAMRILSRQNIYLKNVSVIESLAKIDVMVFDKTGTITDNSSSQVEFIGTPLNDFEAVLVKSLCMNSMHPISQAITNFFKTSDHSIVENFVEFQGQGISGVVNGKMILVGNRTFLSSKGISMEEKTGNGTFLVLEGELKGMFELKSKYKMHLDSIFKRIRKWAKIFLLSGDGEKEKNNLIELFNGAENMFFRKSPQQKLEFIKDLQLENNKVAMIGDGLNDAGALNASEVGIVISDNISNFTPACDIILQSNQFEKLPLLFDYSRSCIQLVKVSYLIALAYNLIGLSFAVRGVLSPVIAAILMPLSSISIVIFGVGLSTFTAYKLGLLQK